MKNCIHNYIRKLKIYISKIEAGREKARGGRSGTRAATARSGTTATPSRPLSVHPSKFEIWNIDIRKMYEFEKLRYSKFDVAVPGTGEEARMGPVREAGAEAAVRFQAGGTEIGWGAWSVRFLKLFRRIFSMMVYLGVNINNSINRTAFHGNYSVRKWKFGGNSVAFSTFRTRARILVLTSPHSAHTEMFPLDLRFIQAQFLSKRMRSDFPY